MVIGYSDRTTFFDILDLGIIAPVDFGFGQWPEFPLGESLISQCFIGMDSYYDKVFRI